MSAISSRPKVRKVSSSSAPLAGAFAGALIAAALRGLGAAARTAFESHERLRRALPAEITPRLEFVSIDALPSTLNPTDKIQVSTLLAVASAPCVVDRPREISQKMELLAKACSLQQATRVQGELFAALETGHQRAFLQSLSQACAKAAARVGFPNLEVKSGSAGELRLVAGDAAGRALVTEIALDRNHDVRLETEVIGVTDGSCHHILDRFDEALEAEGVRSAGRGRRSTGGVCVLAAARDATRRKAGTVAKRSQRLNQTVTQRSGK